jgi:rsbT co-antagonist protein RsbR
MAERKLKTADILRTDTAGVLADWMAEIRAAAPDTRISAGELDAQATEFLALIGAAAEHGTDVNGSAWQPVREFLEDVSRSRAVQGFSTAETATFIFSLKKPMFSRIRNLAADPQTLADETWAVTEIVDRLGLHTVKTFQKAREDVIARQQAELLELSTPVVKLWEGVIALPMIGTLDSARTQIVMESLLQRIVDVEAEIAIIDITGVPTVDTLVAQHLMKTVTAIRLMGADCIISGIRPQIAQTIVHLGVELQGITTKATLADALAVALQRTGLVVTKARPA